MTVRSSGKLALAGGAPAVTRGAPAWPVAGDVEVSWMEGVVRSGQWSWMGIHEKAFCEEFKGFIGARYAMGLANGTVTIQCALQAVGIEPGDEVLVPGLTWCATAQAAFDIGANVIFVDIDPVTLCLDPAAAAKAITPKTRAMIPVHLYGCMCDMDALTALARKHRLKIVEDVAHQHGSRWRNVGAGALGDAGSFSFQQSKVLSCGEGGAVTCNDEEVFKTVFALKHVGWGPDMEPANRYGHNYRMNEMQAVLLRGGLRRIGEETRLRDENAQHLAARLARLGGPLRAAPRDPRVTQQAYYAMTLVYDPKKAGGLCKHAYLWALAAERARFSETYWPVYRAPLLNLYDRTSPVPYRREKLPQDYRTLKLPNTERAVADTAVVLPHPHLLGDKAYLDQLAAAVDRVNHNLPAVSRKWTEKCRTDKQPPCCHAAAQRPRRGPGRK